MTKIALRFFLEEASDTAAQLVAHRLRDLIASRLPAIAIKRIQPYWKIPAYREVCFEAPAGDNPTTLLDDLISRLGGPTGWMMIHEREAVWNPAPGVSCVEPTVRWAQAELLEIA